MQRICVVAGVLEYKKIASHSGQIILDVVFFFTRLQTLPQLDFNKFGLCFNREIFQMIRASLDYRRSEIHSIS